MLVFGGVCVFLDFILMDLDGLRLGIPVWHLSFATPRWMRSFINRVIGIWGSSATNMCFFCCFLACDDDSPKEKDMHPIRSFLGIKTAFKRFEVTKKCEVFSHHFKPERLLYAFMMQQFSILTPQDSLNCHLLEAFLEIHQAKG